MGTIRQTTRFSRFLASGTGAAMCEFLTFLLLTHFVQANIFWSQTISFLIGLVVSYSLNRLWVFESTRQVRHELPLYTILAMANLILTNLLMYFVIKTGILSWAAKILVMACAALWNYVIFQKLIFDSSSQKVE